MCLIAPEVNWRHDILEFIALQLPTRQLRSLADGGYATKDYLRELPDKVHAVGRLPIQRKALRVASHPDEKASWRPTQKRRVHRLT